MTVRRACRETVLRDAATTGHLPPETGPNVNYIVLLHVYVHQAGRNHQPGDGKKQKPAAVADPESRRNPRNNPSRKRPGAQETLAGSLNPGVRPAIVYRDGTVHPSHRDQ